MAEAETTKKTYELTLIISSDLSEFDAEKAVDKVKTSITGKGGEITNTSDWGKKKLAYAIKGGEYGFYHTLIFDLSPDNIAPLTHELELAPEVLRYLMISLEKEGVTPDQLFSPEKEQLMISSAVKEKLAPKVVSLPPAKAAAPAAAAEPEIAISKEELDQKIDEVLKSDIE